MKKKIVSGLLAMATVMSMSGFMIPAHGLCTVGHYDEAGDAAHDLRGPRAEGRCFRVRAHCGHHGREKDERAYPDVPSHPHREREDRH